MYTFDNSGFNTQTERLEQRTGEIVEVLRDGNVWKIGNGISLLLGCSGLLLGNVALSPLVLLLLFGNIAGAIVAYLSYCLHESETLGILPNFLPLVGGMESDTLSGLLTNKERLHHQAVTHLGIEKVKAIELAGGLPRLLELVEDLIDHPEAHNPVIYTRLMREINQSISLAPSDRPSPRRRGLPTSNPVDLQEENNYPVATADNLPPIRDLPREISTLKRHVLFVASTTSGKTTALTQVIAHALNQGYQVTALDGKGNLSLKDSGAVYRHCNTPERAVDAIDILERTVSTMRTRQDLALKGHTDFTPISIMIDELNLIRAFLKQDSKESLDTFSSLLVHLLLQGASYEIFFRLSAHTSRLPKLGLDGGEADSLSFIALGRGGSYESLEDVLEWQINGRKSEKFQDELDNLIHSDFRETLCFSTIAPMGFFRLPFVDRTATAFTPPTELDIRSSLDRLYQSSTAQEPPAQQRQFTPSPKPPLESPLKEIYEFARKQEIVKARDVQNYVTGCKKIPPYEIRSYFQQLEEMEYGYTEGEGSQLSFSVYS